MSERQPIVVDTNILFSALLRPKSSFADILLGTENHFFVCEQVVIELFKLKEKLVKTSQLSKEDLISLNSRAAAHLLCKDIDENDTPHVALTLELNGLLWTGDKKLKEGLRRKGFNQFFISGSS